MQTLVHFAECATQPARVLHCLYSHVNACILTAAHASSPERMVMCAARHLKANSLVTQTRKHLPRSLEHQATCTNTTTQRNVPRTWPGLPHSNASSQQRKRSCSDTGFLTGMHGDVRRTALELQVEGHRPGHGDADAPAAKPLISGDMHQYNDAAPRYAPSFMLCSTCAVVASIVPVCSGFPHLQTRRELSEDAWHNLRHSDWQIHLLDSTTRSTAQY